MNIKQRIFFSNIIMFIFLLVYSIGVLFYSVNSLTEAYKSYNAETLELGDESVLSAYEIQTIAENFTEIARKTNCEMVTTSEGKKYVEDLMSSGSLMMTVLDGKVIYISEHYKYDTLLYEASVFLGTEPVENEMCYKENGYFFDSTFTDPESGSKYKVVILNTNVTVSKTTGQRGEYVSNLIGSLKNNVQSFMFVGAVTIIIINLVLVTVVTNSIMKPLNELKEGTQKILNDDLDFTIEYSNSDEISEVLDSFENMRQQLLESREAQKKYEVNRKRLIAGISHDLRTPLTSIKGYVSGLIDGIADTDEKREVYLKTIYNTADDMDKLVDDLFLFSKLDLDKLPFDFEEFDITEFMALCCDEIKFSLEKKNVALTYKDFCGCPVYVSIDRNKFARVLLNIADNTVKYKKNTIGSLYVTTEKKKDFVEIRLKDDGIGVSQGNLEKIFESFYRSDSARTNPVKGSGLGLAIAKQIVEAHGGKISAESNIGEGLTIIIDIPYDKEKQPD